MKTDLLASAVIYGANASGKSNLVRALHAFRSFVVGSASEGQAQSTIEQYEPFRLSADSLVEPCSFEMEFLVQGVRHQYGFAVFRNEVQKEWLTAYPKSRPQKWFRRELSHAGEQSFHFSEHLTGENKRLEKLTRPNALFLSVAQVWNHEQLTPVFVWIREQLRTLPGSLVHEGYTTSRLSDTSFQSWASNLLAQADLGIKSVRSVSVPRDEWVSRTLPPDLPDEIRKKIIASQPEEVSEALISHTGKSNFTSEFSLVEESSGTQKLFALLGPVRDVLTEGRTLVVDELGESMHPLMTRKILGLFHDPTINKKGAQLLFTSHDTTLLSPALLRRDQVWIAEKDQAGASEYFSLSEVKGVRNSEAWSKGYLSGRYGGIPFLDDMEIDAPA